jgi:hypothetical protein
MRHFPVITRANLIVLQHFPVVTSFGAPSFFGLDRAAVPYFGIKVSGSLFPVYQLYVNLLSLWSKSLDTSGLIYILQQLCWTCVHIGWAAKTDSDYLLSIHIPNLKQKLWEQMTGIWGAPKWVRANQWWNTFVGCQTQHKQAIFSWHAWPFSCWWAGQIFSIILLLLSSSSSPVSVGISCAKVLQCVYSTTLSLSLSLSPNLQSSMDTLLVFCKRAATQTFPQFHLCVSWVPVPNIIFPCLVIVCPAWRAQLQGKPDQRMRWGSWYTCCISSWVSGNKLPPGSPNFLRLLCNFCVRTLVLDEDLPLGGKRNLASEL